jgi:hypothetical protein
VEAVRAQGGWSGELHYKTLTAVAHGTPYALMWRGDMTPHPTTPGLNVFAPVADSANLVTDAARVLAAFVDTVKRQVTLFGWRSIPWDAWVTETRRAIGDQLRAVGFTPGPEQP